MVINTDIMPINPKKRQRVESDANGDAQQQVSENRTESATNVLTPTRLVEHSHYTTNQAHHFPYQHHLHHRHSIANNHVEDRYHRFHQRNHQHNETFSQDTSDPWAELFDSFKNANHLKELHCR